MVSYQAGKKDAFYHRYSYDAENRITGVATSHDSVYWENDAYYQYYKHGPLARAVIGQQQVQGVDYAYTLQGWLKGVNSTALTSTYDMGNDSSMVAKDAFGFALHYYGSSDYTPVNSTKIPFADGLISKPLFNGNIAAISQHLPSLGAPLLSSYSYDVLNRLVGMQVANGLNKSTNIWTPIALDDYKEKISYDANGNILTYSRNGNKGASDKPMDRLAYNYKAGKNQLDFITDSVNAAKYDNDIDNQLSGNYAYDSIGNLVKDSAGGIREIKWTVYGKIASIKKADNTIISYAYDVTGNRISKKVNDVQTWYVRDATGNVMSIYTKGDTAVNGGALTQTEIDLYGSSRLGINTLTTNVETKDSAFTNLTGPGAGININFIRGKKFFELSNHLGNVLATVSDKKLGVSVNGSIIDYYTADIVSAQEYYPFGMQMPGRGISSSKYRYGFNGMESDNEVKGDGNSYTTEFREYDSRIGRWLSLDPAIEKYQGWSPYVFAFDNPIWFNDPNGDDPPTIKKIITEGKRLSPTFSSLLIKNSVDINNPEKIIYFGTTGTFTENQSGKISLTKDNDIKYQIIKLTHELSNRKNIKAVQLLDSKVEQGVVNAKSYAKKLAQIEVDGEINQIKVAKEIGYRYSGKGSESINNFLETYSKNPNIDLSKYIIANTEHLKTYEEQGKRLRSDYLKTHPDNSIKDDSKKINTKKGS